MKAYYVETRKESKIIIGNSREEVVGFVRNNKNEFMFDLSGYFNVKIANDVEIENIIRHDDGEIDYIDIKTNGKEDFTTLFTDSVE